MIDSLTVRNGSAIADELSDSWGIIRSMIALNAHFDGKVLIPDEPLALPANQKVRIELEPIDAGQASIRFTPHADPTAALMNGVAFDERDALHIDPLDAVPVDFVRQPGSGAGEIKMSDDFDQMPDDFKDYL